MKFFFLLIATIANVICACEQDIQTHTICYHHKILSSEKDDFAIPLTVIKSSSNNPTKVGVVIVHGSTPAHVLEDKTYRLKKDFLEFSKDIAKNNFHVGVIDYLGGDFPSPFKDVVKKSYSIYDSTLGEDFKKLIDDFKDRTRVTFVIGIFHSFGATYGLHAWSRQPDLFDSVICLGGVFDPVTHTFQDEQGLNALDKLNCSTIALKMSSNVTERFNYNFFKSTTTVWSKYDNPLTNEKFTQDLSPQHWEKGKFPTKPLLVITAKNDTIVCPNQSYEFSKRLKTLGIEHDFIVLSQGGHRFIRKDSEENADNDYDPLAYEAFLEILVNFSQSKNSFNQIFLDVTSGTSRTISNEDFKNQEYNNTKNLLQEFLRNKKGYFQKSLEEEKLFKQRMEQRGNLEAAIKIQENITELGRLLN